MYRIAYVAAAVASLAGCVTAASSASPDEERVGRWAAENLCVISRERSGSLQSTRAAADVTVHSLTPGEDGWVSADISAGRVRDNIYINNRTGKVICGSRGLAETGKVFHPAETPSATWLKETEEALQVLNLGKPIK